MFLRRTERKKNGKTHHYWSVVENRRVDGGRVVQRHVLYLGEINSSQAAAWRKTIEVFDEDAGRPRTMALFPEDRCEAAATRCIRRSASPVGDAASPSAAMGRLLAGRTVVAGACSWIGSGPSACRRAAKETRWDQVLQVLAAYRLIAPGSEWRLHRQWFEQQRDGRSAGRGLRGWRQEDKLYRCLDRLLAHKEALFAHLVGALARSVRRQVRRAAVRSDQHLLRDRRRRTCRRATSAGTATAATSGPTACRW